MEFIRIEKYSRSTCLQVGWVLWFGVGRGLGGWWGDGVVGVIGGLGWCLGMGF